MTDSPQVVSTDSRGSEPHETHQHRASKVCRVLLKSEPKQPCPPAASSNHAYLILPHRTTSYHVPHKILLPAYLSGYHLFLKRWSMLAFNVHSKAPSQGFPLATTSLHNVSWILTCNCSSSMSEVAGIPISTGNLQPSSVSVPAKEYNTDSLFARSNSLPDNFQSLVTSTLRSHSSHACRNTNAPARVRVLSPDVARDVVRFKTRHVPRFLCVPTFFTLRVCVCVYTVLP